MPRFNLQSLSIIPRTQQVNLPIPQERNTPPGGFKRFKFGIKMGDKVKPYLKISGAEYDYHNGKYYLTDTLVNGRPTYVNDEYGYDIHWTPYAPTLEEKPGFWTIANYYDSNTMDENYPESNVWDAVEWRNSTGTIIPIVVIRVGI